MEFTQPLGVGLGLVLGLNPQDSHPVCIRAQSHMHATINGTWENSWESSNSNGIWYSGIIKTWELVKCVNDVQMRQTDEL